MIEQKITILAQDKDYLQRQVEHLNQSKLLSEQKIEQLNQQLSESRQNRESLYDKLVNVRCIVPYVVVCVLLVGDTQGDTQNGVRVSTGTRTAAIPFQN